ncbi:hypothetical protein [Alistipes sp. cv1]|uniref:hypothetical protein n=1 Tax=Alistipes sp. cv1 TaxID=1622071 RepID=UPI0011AF8744|nr:hypothetical protein [Alistipes sp. cv1]
MKKSILAAILLSGGFIAVTMHMKRNDPNVGDLLLKNVEALSGDESSEKFKYSCHNGVYIDTSENATSVMYCGSCDYVKASDAFDRSECSR